MNEAQAAGKADKLIDLLITHQPALFGTHNALSSKDAPEEIAQRLSDLRSKLIEKLKPQQA